MSDRWALRRALKDGDLYDPRQRVRLDLDEIAHPADVAANRAQFRDWGSWYEDLAGIGAVFRPKSILEIGVGLGYSGWCLCSGALLGGRLRLRYVGLDAEREVGSPGYGYRTLAMAAETFRRYLPEARTQFYLWDTVQNDLPPEVQAQRFGLAHVDGDQSACGTFGDLRRGWGLLVPEGVLVASRLHGDDREQGLTHFFSWLIEANEPFTSQWLHNEQSIVLFRKDKE